MTFVLPDLASHPACPDPTFPDALDDFDFGPKTLKREIARLGVVAAARAKLDERERSILHGQLRQVQRSVGGLRAVQPGTEGEHLAKNGVMAGDVSAVGLLRDILSPDIKRLGEKAVADPLPINQIDRSTQISERDKVKAVIDVLTSYGFMEEASIYRGRPMQVVAVKLQISRPEDRHHYQTFRDCEGTTKLLNLHMDPVPVLKAIIYLNEVTERNGPFQMVPGSLHWEYDETERLFGAGNSVGNYCHTPLHRKVACALPRRCRKTIIIGKLIADDSPESALLLSKLHSFTSAEANVMLFDAAYNWHRGGLCDEGERINLQVVIK